jgi:hypothetical protein
MITLDAATRLTKTCVESLDADFRARVKAWITECCEQKLTPYIYEGRRTMQRQAELWAIGRTTLGKIVTKARPGQSYHNYGLAFDWVPLVRHPKKEGYYMAMFEDEAAYRKGAAIGKPHLIVPISWESGHLQDGKYASLADVWKVFGKPNI